MPALVKLVVSVATPLLTVAVPKVVVPSLNVTVPVGLVPVTVAVSVTVWLSPAGLGVALKVVVVLGKVVPVTLCATRLSFK